MKKLLESSLKSQAKKIQFILNLFKYDHTAFFFHIPPFCSLNYHAHFGETLPKFHSSGWPACCRVAIFSATEDHLKGLELI